MHPHRRQFVVGPQKFILNEAWKTYPLGGEIWLSCCPDLRVAKAVDATGKNWYILGLAVETSPDKTSPEDEIAKTKSGQVPDLCPGWSGRWILIGGGTLHLDASGLLGCFYGQNSQGNVWASSSSALLTQILFPNQPIAVDSRKLIYEVGISWYTPPLSRFKGISRLLPSQVLSVASGDILPRPLMPEICPERNYKDVLREIREILETTLKRLSQKSPELWLGLTAGYDSRLMLALSQAADIQVKPYTRIAARMSVGDQLLPPQLARTCGYSHTFLRRRKRFPERQPLADAHSGEHVSAGDAEPFVRGDRDELKGITFGGHGFAIASGFYKLRDLPMTLNSAAEGARQIADLFQEPSTSTATEGLQQWLRWSLAHPEPNLDWRDRFFIEQRQAGWLSSKEQVYDLVDLERFPILNCAMLNSLLLSIPVEQRLGSRIQTTLLKQLSPDLMAYPFNPDDFHFGLRQMITSKAQDLPQYIFGKSIKKIRYFLRFLGG